MPDAPDQPQLLRFAVLWHDGIAQPHFDILIERTPGGALAAWRSGDWPILAPTPLAPLPDHRRLYLEYQGPISGDRGRVTRVAGGSARVRQGAQWWVRFDDGSAIILGDALAEPWDRRDDSGPPRPSSPSCSP